MQRTAEAHLELAAHCGRGIRKLRSVVDWYSDVPAVTNQSLEGSRLPITIRGVSFRLLPCCRPLRRDHSWFELKCQMNGTTLGSLFGHVCPPGPIIGAHARQDSDSAT
jgi:hypothetical protein